MTPATAQKNRTKGNHLRWLWKKNTSGIWGKSRTSPAKEVEFRQQWFRYFISTHTYNKEAYQNTHETDHSEALLFTISTAHIHLKEFLGDPLTLRKMWEFSMTSAGCDRLRLHFPPLFSKQNTYSMFFLQILAEISPTVNSELFSGKSSTAVTHLISWCSCPSGKMGPVTRALPSPFPRSEKERPKSKWQFMYT